MKRWRDRGGFDDEERFRQEVSEEPLRVQAVAPSWRGRKFIIPVAIAAVAVTFLLATAGRFAAYFAQPSAPTPTPTVIAWTNAAIVRPPTPSLTPSGSPDPEASPAPATPAPAKAPIVRVSLSPLAFSYVPGQTAHFNVTLTNDSAAPLSLDPCPTYEMYLPGSAVHEERLLNCAAASSILGAGQSLVFEMLFVVPDDAPMGQQQLVWILLSGLNGNGSTTIAVWPAGKSPAS